MKWLLTFLAVAVIVGGLGYGAWFMLQTSDELDQAHATINSLNANLNTMQGRLSEAQTNAANAQGQLDAEKARTNILQQDLESSQAKVYELERALAAINDLLDGMPGDDIAAEISRLNGELAKANAELADSIAANKAAVTELTKLKNPRHFYSLQELKDWLEQDDTNTNPDYASLSLADKAFVLQVKALRDGFILPAAIDADDDYIYSWNIAVIGASIYVVIADTDEVSFLAAFGAPPINPSFP